MLNRKNRIFPVLVVITAAALLFAVSTGASSDQGKRSSLPKTDNDSMFGGGGTVFTYTGTPQTYTVPPGVTSVTIEGIGAQGGSVTTTCAASGGRGAQMSGTFAVTPGEVLTIVVGQQGRTNNADGGGGGGTYVVRTGNVPLLVAGGGGGATNDTGQCRTTLRDGVDASITTSGTASGNGLVLGGTGGNGGGASSGSGGGGGGFLTDGVAGIGLAGNNGKSYLNGSAGGNGNNNDGGGYGGGGAGWFTGGNGGGGGGYSGGGTSGSQPFTGGGGGGSYNIGTNQNNSVATGTGDGSVTISPICPTVSVDFNYTGAVQTWIVPTGVTSVNIQAFGAQGGVVFPSNTNYGGSAQGDLAVTPGETLSIYVGGQGLGNTGGFNGGGNGETGSGSGGTGGGGASDVRQGGIALTDRKLVAGGGGGGGSSFSGLPVNGGQGGGLIGGNGYRDPSYAANPGGVGGNQSSSGDGTCVTLSNPSMSGGFGFGGTPVGFGCGCDGFGGGGGWYGGGGSGNCRGAGGGSSYIDGVTSGATTSGIRAGDGLVTISYSSCSSGSNLTGTVTMANAPATLIPDVTIAATGATPAVSDGVTNNSGVYSMTGFGPESYTITPSKSPYPVLAYNGIFSNDATLISRHVVGLDMLSPEQLRAAKVAGLPNLSSYDAALLAQYIVGVTNPINKTGTWTFTPASASLIVGPSSTADFAASLMGDVNGDWVPPGNCRGSQTLCRTAGPLTDPKRIRNAVQVSLAMTKASSGPDLTVPVRIDNLRGRQVDSFQFDIYFDPEFVSPAELAASLDGTLASNLTIAFNSPQKGLLKVVVYGAYPASGDGVYVNLHFRVTGTTTARLPISVQNFRMNDGNDDVYTVDRQLKVSQSMDGVISK